MRHNMLHSAKTELRLVVASRTTCVIRMKRDYAKYETLDTTFRDIKNIKWVVVLRSINVRLLSWRYPFKTPVHIVQLSETIHAPNG
jgi:hypothetical protein